MDKAWVALLALMAVGAGCGPMVEGPFEGEGRYEGRYRDDESPRGWRTDKDEGRITERPAPGPQAPVAQEEPRVVPADLQEALGTLRESVDGFRASSDPEHAELVDALRNLADALDLAPGARPSEDRLDQIRTYANRIEKSAADSPQHGEWAKAALEQGVEALTSMARADERTLPGVDQLQARIDRLDAGRPLNEQRDAYADALQEMTGLIRHLARPEPVRGTR